MIFSCRTCDRPNLKLEDMKKEKYLLSNNRGQCNVCIASYEKVRKMIKKAEKSPEDYMSCNSCDRIFSIYEKGAPDKFGFRKKNKCCSFCKSTDIEEF